MSTNKSRSVSNRCCTHASKRYQTRPKDRYKNTNMADLKQNSGCDTECARIPGSLDVIADEICCDYRLIVSHS
jgi:hypothetical protein